ncbi:YgiT-type zinc finger protein [Pseudomonas mediterranea]|uniref:HTH-type transcriptional regulator / antitoxin MqsA n=1 Tax=Pseudomonas mediterranea TaxID=183795 RepID=A0AAX2DBF9_9PSED|nr:type II TA system antitoxin MqsA family protein [Pseudomonas mediterranea]KGU85272.1 transcriptional regulator [Pseudomonas mediterranea CFBP 5447]MBL0843810.1 type II toxin-antitoxin system MqsA family antitoxin [Pseudomonas mediterranea]QHA84326.1 YgiT-type zinc finger protein [Pseudomonas mediterranea]SDU37216.1 HTH-type transcriptional regulator / antitoxin MqsA [Pseudomonas mediterranea]
MTTQQCFSCGAPEGMLHFEGRGETLSVKGLERRVDDLSGWECRMCGEVELDTGCAERHAKAGDELVNAARQMIGEEIKRIRRKLHLSQKDAVSLLSGGGHNAMSRYERGEVLPPKPLMLLMRLLDLYPHLLADARTLAEGADLRQFKTTVHKEHEILTDS